METITSLSRRGILKMAAGALVVRFALGQPSGDAAKSLDPTEVDSFIAIHADGSVTIYTSKVDVGTGLATAFRQTAAEELGIPVERFTVIEGDSALTPDHGGTGGSSGIPRGAADIRRAAATARQALLDLGAKQLNQPASELTIAGGEVTHSSGQRVTVASLVAGKRLRAKVNANAPLKNPSTYIVVGKPILRADVPGKCTAKHRWLQDLTLRGMLHGCVVRPPSIGAKLLSVEENSIRAVPGVRVIRIESFLGVVAADEWAAVRAAKEIKATWSDSQSLPGSGDLSHWVRQAPVDPDQALANRGGGNAALSSAPKQLSATYYWPFQSHASLG